MPLPHYDPAMTLPLFPALSDTAEAVVAELAGKRGAPPDEQLVRLRGLPPDDQMTELADELRGVGLRVSRVAFAAAAGARDTATCEACFVHVLVPEAFLENLAAHTRHAVKLVTTF